MNDFSLRVKWLSRVKEAQEEFDNAADEYLSAQSNATRITPNFSGMPSSHVDDKICASVFRIEAARKKKMEAGSNLCRVKREVYTCITSSGLQPDDIRLLVMIYIDGASQNEAAKVLGKTSAGGTYIHRRAVSGLKMPPGWHMKIQ